MRLFPAVSRLLTAASELKPCACACAAWFHRAAAAAAAWPLPQHPIAPAALRYLPPCSCNHLPPPPPTLLLPRLPTDWLFGPMWTVLYAAMGYAAHRVWQAGGGPLPLALYGVGLWLHGCVGCIMHVCCPCEHGSKKRVLPRTLRLVHGSAPRLFALPLVADPAGLSFA